MLAHLIHLSLKILLRAFARILSFRLAFTFQPVCSCATRFQRAPKGPRTLEWLSACRTWNAWVHCGGTASRNLSDGIAAYCSMWQQIASWSVKIVKIEYVLVSCSRSSFYQQDSQPKIWRKLLYDVDIWDLYQGSLGSCMSLWHRIGSQYQTTGIPQWQILLSPMTDTSPRPNTDIFLLRSYPVFPSLSISFHLSNVFESTRINQAQQASQAKRVLLSCPLSAGIAMC